MTEHHSAPEIVIHKDHDDDWKRIGLVDDCGSSTRYPDTRAPGARPPGTAKPSVNRPTSPTRPTHPWLYGLHASVWHRSFSPIAADSTFWAQMFPLTCLVSGS